MYQEPCIKSGDECQALASLMQVFTPHSEWFRLCLTWQDYQRLLASQPSRRLNPAKLAESAALKTALVDAIAFLEQLAVKDSNEKDLFFKRLPAVIPSLALPVAQRKVCGVWQGPSPACSACSVSGWIWVHQMRYLWCRSLDLVQQPQPRTSQAFNQCAHDIFLCMTAWRLRGFCIAASSRCLMQTATHWICTLIACCPLQLLPMLASALEFGGAPAVALGALLQIGKTLDEDAFAAQVCRLIRT